VARPDQAFSGITLMLLTGGSILFFARLDNWLVCVNIEFALVGAVFHLVGCALQLLITVGVIASILTGC
jgi:hypothetical protein